MVFVNLVLVFILLAFNAFFAAFEYALIAARKSRLALLDESDNPIVHLVMRWLENPEERDRLIAANQVGITIINLALGAIGENTFTVILTPLFSDLVSLTRIAWIGSIISWIPLVINLLIFSILGVVLGEQVPKVAVLRSPEKYALFAAPVMRFIVRFFSGFISMLDWLTRVILRMIGISVKASHHSSITLEEMKYIFAGKEMEGIIEKPEREMMSAIIDFGELIVRQVAIPRTEIIAVEADVPFAQILDVIAKNSVTKLPVYDDDLDQILGVLHIRDVILAMQKKDYQGITARQLTREALFIPETISVNDLLKEFQLRKQHLAIVMDEYGGTAGLVTLEDLVDEILGEYRDPFDSSPPSIQYLPEGKALIEGMTLISEINETFKTDLHDPHYDTIAGFILGKMGRIPRIGDKVEIPEHNLVLEVNAMDHLRVSQVLYTRKSESK